MKDSRDQAPPGTEEQPLEAGPGRFQKIKKAYHGAKVTDEGGQRKKALHFFYAALVLFFAFSGLTQTIRSLAQGQYFRFAFGLVQLGLFILAFLMIRRVIRAQKTYAILAFILGLILFFPMALGPIFFDPQSARYSWPESGYSTALPEPQSEFGDIYVDNEESFHAGIYKVTRKDYQAYTEECKARGFIHMADSLEDAYYALDDQELRLLLEYEAEREELSILISPYYPSEPFEWPRGTAADLLPLPPSNTGAVWETEPLGVQIFLAETTREAYTAYVEECIAKGFDDIISRDDISFQALNDDGSLLTLDYWIGRRMEISIFEADESWSITFP